MTPPVPKACNPDPGFTKLLVVNPNPLPAPKPTLHIPPTRPGRVSAVKGPAVWPLVLGIIGLVFGIGSMVASIIGLLMPVLSRSMFSSGPAALPMANVFGVHSTGLIIYYACTIALSSVLVMASVRLIKRKPDSTTWLIFWALMKFVHAVFAVYFTMEVQRTSLASQQGMFISSSKPPNPQVMASVNNAVIWATGVFIALWSVWGPIFVLCWFSRAKVRAEVAKWSKAPTANIPSPTAASPPA